MSFTYAPKASQTRQRGRGRGGGTRGRGTAGTVISKPSLGSQPMSTVKSPSSSTRTKSNSLKKQHVNRSGKMDPSMEEDNPSNGNPTNANVPANQTTDRMQRRDAYTVISPNEKKRQQVAAQAQQETKAFEQYKQSQKLERVSYVGTVGGGQVTSEASARKKLDQDQRHSKYERMLKSQQYRADQKKREESEYQQKKDLARKKAQENKEQCQDRDGRLQAEHRRTNEAFLARLEREQKMKKYKIKDASPTSSSIAKPKSSISASSAAAMAEAPDPTDQLSAMFPSFDRQTLMDILEQCNGNVKEALNLING